MTGPDGTFRTANPFPISPVVQLRVIPQRRPEGATAEEAPVSIATPTWGRVWAQVEEYLEHSEEVTTRGRALALIGELGRGKSHLARQVVTQVQARDEAVPVWVIDRPGTDLTGLYRDQLTATFEDRNAREAFERVVETFHAQVTANALADDDSTGLDDQTRSEFVRLLRTDELDSRKVVRSFDINEDVIHRHLRRELREVTGHKQFAAAFALLLDLRFRDLVWAWLTGGVPDESLVERGITKPIQGVRDVLDALTVFGFLHGQVGKPYVLVVDALDEAAGSKEFLPSFESLVDIYVNRGGLLLLTTLPESWSGLPRGLRERVLQIWPPRMSRAEAGHLVAAHVRRAQQREQPGDEQPQDEQLPFTVSALDQLMEIGDGVPRQILRICRRAWSLSDERPPPTPGLRVIDAALVHDAVRTLTELRARSDVEDEVRRVLADGQWAYGRRPSEVDRVMDPQLDQVSYWVRTAEQDVVAVLVVSSVLNAAEVGDIEATAAAARAAFDGTCRLLVLVNGTIARTRSDQLAGRIGTVPLVVGERNTKALGAAVKQLADQLAGERRGGGLASVGRRLGAMAEDQTAVLDTVRRLEAALRHAGPAADAAEERLLPEAVAERFAAAERSLAALGQTPQRIAAAFRLDSDGRPQTGARATRLVFDAEQLTGLGLASAIGHLVRAFRAGILDWQRAARRRPDLPDAVLAESLFVLCRSFDISLEVLPDLGGTGPGGSDADPEEADRRAEARALLDGLAEGVRRDLAPPARDRVSPAATPR